jgi:hypothetical protein
MRNKPFGMDIPEGIHNNVERAVDKAVDKSHNPSIVTIFHLFA